MDSVEQGIPEQWFFHDRDIGLFCSLAQPGTGVACDQDGGRVDVTVAQLRDQLEPAHARQLLVNDEAIAVSQIVRIEQFLSRRMAVDLETFDSERECQRVENGQVVLNHKDDKLRSCAFSRLFHCLLVLVLDMDEQKLRDPGEACLVPANTP